MAKEWPGDNLAGTTCSNYPPSARWLREMADADEWIWMMMIAFILMRLMTLTGDNHCEYDSTWRSKCIFRWSVARHKNCGCLRIKATSLLLSGRVAAMKDFLNVSTCLVLAALGACTLLFHGDAFTTMTGAPSHAPPHRLVASSSSGSRTPFASAQEHVENTKGSTRGDLTVFYIIIHLYIYHYLSVCLSVCLFVHLSIYLYYFLAHIQIHTYIIVLVCILLYLFFMCVCWCILKLIKTHNSIIYIYIFIYFYTNHSEIMCGKKGYPGRIQDEGLLNIVTGLRRSFTIESFTHGPCNLLAIPSFKIDEQLMYLDCIWFMFFFSTFSPKKCSHGHFWDPTWWFSRRSWAPRACCASAWASACWWRPAKA